LVGGLISVAMAIGGWVTYRFRETRAMTMAQFFEIRYSKKFRVFSGMVCWLSGIINYGIFPIVTARVIVYLMGMPLTVPLAGFEIQTTSLVMPAILAIAVYLTLSGGQIAVMVTDFLQGSLATIVFVVIITYLYIKFGGINLFESFGETSVSASMVNPFKMEGGEFDGFFFASFIFMMLYGFMTWQGGQGYYSAAKNPHEARMSKIWAMWRWAFLWNMLLVLAIIAIVIFNHPGFSSMLEPIQASLSKVSDTHLQEQLRVPIILRHILPTGLLGLICAAFVGIAISTDDSNLHSWGSIFIQDVVLPIRKKHMSPKQHITFLRISVIGVAVFVYLFSMFFPLKDYLMMFMQITGAIYVGGAGCAIIGGLYWKRSTTAGAWAGMITGMFFAVFGIVLQSIIWPNVLPALKEAYPNIAWLAQLPKDFPLNGMIMSALSALIASAVYVAVSLLNRKPAFNMERMLHRGKYAIEGEHEVQDDAAPARGWRVLFNFGGREFTKRDLFISWFAVGSSLYNLGLVIVVTIVQLTVGIHNKIWLWYRAAGLGMGLVTATIMMFIIFGGGFRNLFELFRDLKTAKRDEADDGTVVAGHNLVDEKVIGDKLDDDSE